MYTRSVSFQSSRVCYHNHRTFHGHNNLPRATCILDHSRRQKQDPPLVLPTSRLLVVSSWHTYVIDPWDSVYTHHRILSLPDFVRRSSGHLGSFAYMDSGRYQGIRALRYYGRMHVTPAIARQLRTSDLIIVAVLHV